MYTDWVTTGEVGCVLFQVLELFYLNFTVKSLDKEQGCQMFLVFCVTSQ